ncbi:ATP-binding protein [Spirillospora sp. NPDC047279]|uniref:ATP-binding protein n=1 Tax=Spirillospora sp. NPDC047279 TaxID=3155478 RepID=UPI00340C6868
MTETVTPDELRPLFLFERLDDDQLEWLCKYGSVRSYGEGEIICAQGDPAEFFFVLLDGEIAQSQLIHDHQAELSRTARPGVYGGAVMAYLDDRIEQRYAHTLRALRPTRMFVLPGRKFGKVVREWFPMAAHLLEGIFFGMSNARRIADQRERLTALGTITAGLTHELNNPAAAASRASAELGDRLVSAQKRLAELATAGVDCERLAKLVKLREHLNETESRPRSPMEVSDAEDEMGDWLEEHDVAGAWELAPGLVAAGLGVADAEAVAEVAGEAQMPAAMRWLAEILEIGQLQAEISDATGRITTLLDSARQYSQLDRAPYQRADLGKLLDSTLTMLKRKLAKIQVVREYDPDLPEVPVYAAELNQVWTNLFVNAIYAMDYVGTLTIRTARENDHALVQITDTGVGIAEENLTRIFTPFFTTKPVGQGTGLGLDISWRIVVDRHDGDIRVESRPGETRFEVLLPLTDDRPPETA